MKTSEFLQKVQDLGYLVKHYEFYIYINNYNSELVAVVATHEYAHMSVNYEGYELLDNDDREDLFNLIVEYATTPVQDRKDERKYFLMLPSPMDKDIGYLNYDKELNQYIFADNDQDKTYQTQFTREEINSFPNQDLIKVLIRKRVELDELR